MDVSDLSALRDEIVSLEERLKAAKENLRRIQHHESPHGSIPAPNFTNSSNHTLLLLSDSALPLGSFAYSSGLESFLAHQKPYPKNATPAQLFRRFLRLSIMSVTFTNVPYLLAGFRQSSLLEDLDNDFDASTPCTVARRASVAQGRALVSVWENALRLSVSSDLTAAVTAGGSVASFAKTLKSSILSSAAIKDAYGHFAPLWGVVCLALGLEVHQTAYLFLLNHAKAVLSAAVRAGVLGPYQAQSVLAGQDLQAHIRDCVERVWNVLPEDAGQVVPITDLWVGRHELLYSRIFNS